MVSQGRGVVSRESLYEEIWAEPISKVALRYNVSGSFLARICTRLNIPRPPRGYWAMVAAGKNMPRAPLPVARPGDELEWARHGRARVAQLPRPNAEAVFSQKPRRNARLPERHPLLKGVKELILEGNELSCGLLKPRKHILIDVLASKSTLDRALDVANDLFLSMERRGHSVMLEPYGQNLKRCGVDEREKGGRYRQDSELWSPSRCTLVFIGTVAFGITVFEMTENVEVQYQNGKYTRVSELPGKNPKSSSYPWRTTTTADLPSGRLCVQVYSPYHRVSWVRHWCEAKAGDFPRKLSGIVKELEAVKADIVRLVEEGERKAEIERQQRELQKREQERQEADRLRLKAEAESHRHLSGIIHSWAKAKRIEQFFSDAELQATELSAEERETIRERLKLAREMIGSTDAIQWFAGWKTPEETLTDMEAERRRRRNFILGIHDSEDES